LTIGETGTANADVLQETQVANLVKTQLLVKETGGLLSVGLHAPHVVGVLLDQVGDQIGQGVLEVGTSGRGPLCGFVDGLAVGEDFLGDGVARLESHRLEVLEQGIGVLVQEANDPVGHITGVVLDAEHFLSRERERDVVIIQTGTNQEKKTLPSRSRLLSFLLVSLDS